MATPLHIVKRRLAALRYDQPLGAESAPLVERLLDDLVQSQAKQVELSTTSTKHADELSVVEQHMLPLRKENARLIRENNELHMQLIADAEAAAAARDELAVANARLQSQNGDLHFIGSQQASQLTELQSENDQLRGRFHEALVQNGIVLPSGHEVRWHGRKEHMKAHSPVAPAMGAADTAFLRATTETSDVTVARQLQVAAMHASHLQRMLDDSNAHVDCLSDDLTAARAAIEQRDAELARLQTNTTTEIAPEVSTP